MGRKKGCQKYGGRRKGTLNKKTQETLEWDAMMNAAMKPFENAILNIPKDFGPVTDEEQRFIDAMGDDLYETDAWKFYLKHKIK